MHNSEPESIFLKSDPCRSSKILSQPLGPQKHLAEGPQSH